MILPTQAIVGCISMGIITVRTQLADLKIVNLRDSSIFLCRAGFLISIPLMVLMYKMCKRHWRKHDPLPWSEWMKVALLLGAWTLTIGLFFVNLNYLLLMEWSPTSLSIQNK